MKKNQKPIDDLWFAVVSSLVITFLMIGVIVAGMEIIKYVGWGR